MDLFVFNSRQGHKKGRDVQLGIFHLAIQQAQILRSHFLASQFWQELYLMDLFVFISGQG
jgi:hypothetical protein